MQDSSPEFEAPPRHHKRMEQMRHIIGQLISERTLTVETDSTGFRVSLNDGLSIYLHTGNEHISTVQEVDVLSHDTLVELSFVPHSLEDHQLGIVARSIYRIGKRGIRVARPRTDDHQSLGDDRLASDTESLKLTTALSRFFYGKKR